MLSSLLIQLHLLQTASATTTPTTSVQAVPVLAPLQMAPLVGVGLGDVTGLVMSGSSVVDVSVSDGSTVMEPSGMVMERESDGRLVSVADKLVAFENVVGRLGAVRRSTL